MTKCINNLTICGETSEIEQFKEALQVDGDGTYHLVQSFIAKRIKKDLQTKLKRASTTKLVFEFESRHTPPSKGLNQIAAIFPKLDFYLEFYEPERVVRGFVHWVNGKVAGHETKIRETP